MQEEADRKAGEMDETEPRETEKDESQADPLAAKDKQISDLKDGLKRLQAEFENFKKRMDKDWTERVKLASERLVLDLLSVLDTFDKALEDGRSNPSAKSLKEGFERTHKQFLHALQREGLKEVRADGKFDPFVHEAVMTEHTDGAEDGQILEVIQKGYSLGNKVIRPARVKVARPMPTEEHKGKVAVAVQDHDEELQEEAAEDQSRER